MEEKIYIIKCSNCNHPIEVTPSDIEWGSVMCNHCDEFVEINENSIQSSKTKPKKIKNTNSVSPDNNSSSTELVEEKKTVEKQSVATYKPNSIKDIDVLLSIVSIKRMGLISIVCAILNPLVTLICAIIGKKRGNELYGVPRELRESLEEAIKYNEKGIKISAIILVIEAIAAIIGIIAFVSEYM